MESRIQNKKYEIEFFSKIASEQSRCEASIQNSLSLYLKSILFKKTPEIIHNRLKVLEAGCGDAKFAKFFLELNPNLKIIGVDIALKVVNLTNKENIPNYHAILGDLENEKLFNNSAFDVILCPFILHHFPSLDKIFSNLTKWLKHEGIIIIVEPNGSNPVNKLSKFIRHLVELIFGKDFIINHKLSTPNETDHTVETYKNFLKKENYEILSITTDTFPMENNSLSLIILIKNILYKFTDVLKYPMFGTSVVIFAKKS